MSITTKSVGPRTRGREALRDPLFHGTNATPNLEGSMIGFNLLAMVAWIIPVATLVITLMLGVRFVRAMERMAESVEIIARYGQGPR